MRHRKNKVTLSRTKAARESMLRTMAADVVLHEGITTSEAKAKAVKPLVEKMITRGKSGSLAARRYLTAFFPTEAAVKKIIDVLGVRYATRPGGYTRITKLGQRQGDASVQVRIELV
jgi:large subunit ribosomal protein L17